MSFSVRSLSRKTFDVVAHIQARKIKDELVARFRTRTSGKIRAVRMLSIEIGIGIHHLHGSTHKPKSMPRE